MGNTSAKPSRYVAKQWIHDKDSNKCHMCCKHFSPARRRHHCRCCGEIFCAECWGTLVKLPADYGYQSDVAVCTACEALFCGKLRFLRMPRRIVLTRALKSNTDMDKPPLSKDLIAKRAFEVFFTKIAHWRPLNDNTHLIFAVTMRTAITNNSSHFNIETSHATASPQKLAPVDGEYDAAARCSELDLSAMRRKAAAFEDLSDDDRCCDAEGRHSSTTGAPQRQHGADQFLTGGSGGGGGGRRGKTRSHVAGDVQLDVAWSLPLDSILCVNLDVHEEGDFISIETHQEVYRLQVADAEGAITAEQEEVAKGGFRVGQRKGTECPAPATLGPPQKKRVSMAGVAVVKPGVDNDGERGGAASDDDDDTLTSKPRKNVRFRLLAQETNSLFIELQDALRLMGERAKSRSRNE